MLTSVIGILIAQLYRVIVDDPYRKVRVRHIKLPKTDGITLAAPNLGDSRLSIEGIIADEDSVEIGPQSFAHVLHLLL